MSVQRTSNKQDLKECGRSKDRLKVPELLPKIPLHKQFGGKQAGTPWEHPNDFSEGPGSYATKRNFRRGLPSDQTSNQTSRKTMKGWMWKQRNLHLKDNLFINFQHSRPPPSAFNPALPTSPSPTSPLNKGKEMVFCWQNKYSDLCFFKFSFVSNLSLELFLTVYVVLVVLLCFCYFLFFLDPVH